MKRVPVIAVLVVLLISFEFFRNSNFSRISLPKSISGPGGEQKLSEIEYTNTDIHWSKFAYIQYVTNPTNLCNSIMQFEILHRLGSKADRLIIFPKDFAPDNEWNTVESRLLFKAEIEYNVKLQSIEFQRRPSRDGEWAESFKELLTFNQTQYKRVIFLDSDSTVLKTMDELFLLPPAPIAMPRAYWLEPEDHILSLQLVLIQPSAAEFARIEEAISSISNNGMEIINNLYSTSAMIIPHRPYIVRTEEWRSKKHLSYIGTEDEEWDPQGILDEAKFLYFSDWPVPKPWIQNKKLMSEKEPTCDADRGTGEMTDCRARDIWRGFYEDFATRRKEVCDMSQNGRQVGLIMSNEFDTATTTKREPIFD